MIRRLVAIIIASIVLAFATVGGLAVLGMGVAGMHMEEGMADVDCLEHCIGVVSSASTGVVPATISTIALVVLFVFVVVAWQSLEIVTVPSIVRWREGIGIRYRHRELAVMRIQD
jgi:hypothetical protein